jgi:non-ribosomal peptide synthetase component F
MPPWTVSQSAAKEADDADTTQMFHERFKQQAELTPDNPAVRFEDQWLTYGELNRRANRLAHRLHDFGVGPESIVALLLPPSVDLIVAILGVGKAGGAYLPLDVDLPDARIAETLDDANVMAVITWQELAGKHDGAVRSAKTSSCSSIYLDTEPLENGPASAENLPTAARPDNLAYVVYTSGSTGKPKGIAVEHRQLANYVSGICRRVGFETGWHSALVTTVAADLGNTVIFPTLCTGGCLHVIAKQRAIDPPRLAEYFRQYPVDCLKITPTHLDALQRYLRTQRGTSGRRATPAHQVRPVRPRRFAPCPTPQQTTIWARSCRCGG